MRSLFADPAVLMSSLGALVLVAAGVGVGRRRTSWTATAIIVPVLLGFAVADADRTRFLSNPFDRYQPWSVAVFAVSLVALAWASVRRPWHAAEAPHGAVALAHVGLAAVACSLFLFIPETDVLRAAPGPLIIVAAAVFGRLLAPLPLPIIAGCTSILAWVGAIDGTARSTTLVGTGLAVLLLAIGLSTVAERLPARHPAATALVILIIGGPTLVGRAWSESVATVTALMVLAVGLVLLWWWRRAARTVR